MDNFGRELLAGYDGFGHREHLHMTWSYLRRAEASAVFPFLQHVAEAHGETEKLNVTMTTFWLAAVAHAIERTGASTFDDLLERAPHLLDKSLAFRHWSRGRILAPEARTGWVEPNLQPLAF